ncbi:RNA-binding protein hfq [Leptolyngbya sp. 'hensonii']|uniref:Hfq-related RNA-binding protein n=1 Tax=Leptolyngbya sp. 'hensonii' TaxID=1922337 RepID=UPI00094F8AB3|nr:RNA chaperone Hfq [Leptolyngbya sp. 'hensonii']OLP16539.1 RNA-binding protein hfq [Leptolyngbya sp. 'hensonii']
MSLELETGLPSVRLIQNLIREGKEVEIQLVTGNKISGKIRWQDPYCLCLSDTAEQTTLIWRQSIACIQLKS